MDILSFEPLSRYTTFGIGGPARYFVKVSTVSMLQEAQAFARKEAVPFRVIGKGSNLLFDDRGYNGLVILNQIGGMKMEENQVWAGAGYSFSLLGVQTARNKLAGLEFACGIPGSVGGAVYMNAGANGAEIKDVLASIEFLNEAGELETLKPEGFSYRTSPFQKMRAVIVGATFHLTPSETARGKQLQIIQYRTETQPYGDQSAGCVFRNPLPASAGALIDQCGLKGFSIGDAAISTLHANFIVNRGQAKAGDVLELVKQIQSIVKEKTGHELEMEVRCIPYEF